jgi:pilus assembly protein CpaC
MDVTGGARRHNRRLNRGAAVLAAAGAMVVLLATGPVRGQDLPTPGPATRPSMIAEGVPADGNLHLTAGKSTVINFRQMYKTIDFGNPDVIAVNHVKDSPMSIIVTAKKPGTTAIVVLDDDNHSTVIDVTVDPDLALLLHQLKQSFPGLDLSVTPLNDSISIRGQVPSMSVSEQVVEMASTYAKVHNFMEIAGGQQVMLQVRIAEVSKNALRNLGVTFGGTDNVSTFTTNGISSGQNTFTFPPAAGASPLVGSVAGNLFGSGRFGVISFDYFITALRTNSLLRDLAEPNLLASSGQEASFMAGGQVAIPVPQPGNGGSTITVQYQPFGVELKFTPNVLGNGRIRLHCAPRVSQVDPSLGTTISGNVVPGFTDRHLDTTVELNDGQSFALAGLLQDNLTASSTKIPLLGDLPVLGALFRSTSYQRNETELVVLVTPRLVAPMNPDQVPLLPGEHWRYPTELGQFLRTDLGGPMVEPGKGRADMKSAGQPPQFHGNYGFTAVGSGSVGPIDTPAK